MKTITVDAHKRVRLPDAKSKRVFAYEPGADGTIRLVPVKAQTKERFPRGSLAKYVIPERNKELLAIFEGCSLEVPE